MLAGGICLRDNMVAAFYFRPVCCLRADRPFCKRPSFALRLSIFYIVKAYLSERKSLSFANPFVYGRFKSFAPLLRNGSFFICRDMPRGKIKSVSCAFYFAFFSFSITFADMKILILLLFTVTCTSANAQNGRYHGDGIDDVLRFVPVVSVYALKTAGVESQSSWKRLAVNTAASFAINVGATLLLKNTVHSTRPDGTDRKSFPSGHTSLAFCGAMILHKEYVRKSPWISVAGFSVAAITAVDRVRRNRHHWPDVLAGAAIGVLSAEAGYLIGDMITGENRKMDVAIMPSGVQLIVKL